MRDSNKLMNSGVQSKAVIRLLPALFVAALSLCFAGCGASSNVSTSRLPVTTTTATKNTYVGSPTMGTWTMTLDDVADTFAYSTSTYPSYIVSQSGSTASSNGFLDFGSSGGASLGKAIELGGSMALLRPGPSTEWQNGLNDQTVGEYLVPMVAQSGCFAISNGPVRYVYFRGGNPGTFVVSTDSTGKNWYFQNVLYYGLNYNDYEYEFQSDLGPEEFNATCTESNGVAVVTAESDITYSHLTDDGLNQVPTFYFHPNGGVVMTRNPPALTDIYNNFLEQGEGETWIGFAAPTSAPTVAQLTSATSYRGFMTEELWAEKPNGNGSYGYEYLTLPVYFMPNGGNTLVGGVYPNDDLTQTPDTTQYTITPGSPNKAVNGTFLSPKLTSIDNLEKCGTGYNAAGVAICTESGYMITGQVDGKNVIFLSSADGTYGEANVYFYLFAQ